MVKYIMAFGVFLALSPIASANTAAAPVGDDMVGSILVRPSMKALKEVSPLVAEDIVEKNVASRKTNSGIGSKVKSLFSSVFQKVRSFFSSFVLVN